MKKYKNESYLNTYSIIVSIITEVMSVSIFNIRTLNKQLYLYCVTMLLYNYFLYPFFRPSLEIVFVNYWRKYQDSRAQKNTIEMSMTYKATFGTKLNNG